MPKDFLRKVELSVKPAEKSFKLTFNQQFTSRKEPVMNFLFFVILTYLLLGFLIWIILA